MIRNKDKDKDFSVFWLPACIAVGDEKVYQPTVITKNSGIVRRLLESSFNFNKIHEDESQQLCSVKRPILQNK